MKTCRFPASLALLLIGLSAGIAFAADPPAGPFKNLGPTGNLERLTRATKLPSPPHLLGALTLAENDQVSIRLAGASNMAAGTTYEMAFDNTKNIWEIFAVSKSKSGKVTGRKSIAAVAVRNQKLGFLWLPGATTDKAAGLFNCGLEITVGPATHFLPFGPPQKVKPLIINLGSRTSRAILPAGLPAPELVHLQVTSAEGLPAAPTFQPADTVSGVEALKLELPAGDLPKIWFQVQLDAKGRAPSVTAVGGFQVTNGAETELSTASAQKLGQEISLKLRIVQQELTKKMGNRAKNELNTQVKVYNAALGELQKLSGFYDTVNKKAKIHFRIFTKIDGEYELTLLETAADAE